MNDTEVGESIARIEVQLKAVIEKLDQTIKSNTKCVDDHEKRIRELEDKQSLLMGKLTALMVVAVSAVSIVIAWVSTWH